jgi:hypothetical protein
MPVKVIAARQETAQEARSSSPGGEPSASQRQGRYPMPRAGKLFRFLAGLILQWFYGTATIRFEDGKVTHVEVETPRRWEYRELPETGPTSAEGVSSYASENVFGGDCNHRRCI